MENAQQVDRLKAIDGMQWSALPGFPGIEFINLNSTFDEARRAGRRTRLVRLAPGAATSKPLVHDYHEEAFLVSGDVEGFNEASAFGSFRHHAFVYRPPGTPHGPIRSTDGCVLLEVHYY